MGLHVFWPASACLTLFVVGVIMVLLKYGDKMCGHRRLQKNYTRELEDDVEEGGYAREISESIA